MAALSARLFLPDGQRFLFATVNAKKNGIYLGGLDGRKPVLLTTDSARFAWMPSGWLLWLRAGALVAQKLDLDKTVLTGQPVTVADNVNAVSASATGLVAYRTGEVAHRRQLTWFDRSGAAKGAIGDPDETLDAPRIARDGRVTIGRQAQGNTDIWLLDGTHASRMTYDKSADSAAVWAPDGARIAFTSLRSGVGDIYQKLSNGSGSEELLLKTGAFKVPTSWSPDGKFLMYMTVDTNTGVDLWILPMGGERKPFVYLATPFSEVLGEFSPDGRWVAYASDETGQFEVYVRPFVPPGTGSRPQVASGQWLVSTGGGMVPRWGPDGKELFFLGPAGEMMAAPISVRGAALLPGTPVRLFQTRIVGGGLQLRQPRQYDVTPGRKVPDQH